MEAALAYFARLVAAFLTGRVFYASTTRSELREAATEAARLVPGEGKRRIGLGLSLILGFVPLIVDEWRSTVEAAKSQGHVAWARRQTRMPGEERRPSRSLSASPHARRSPNA